MECFYLYIFTAPIKQPHNRQGGSCKWYYFNFREGHTGDERKRAMDAFITGYRLGTAAETAVVIVMKQNHATGI